MVKLFQLALDFFSSSSQDESPPLPKPDRGNAGNAVKPATESEQSLFAAPLVTHFHHPRANRSVVLQGAEIFYFHQTARRKTIGMVIGPDGLEVRAPRWVGKQEVEAALYEKASWIVRKLGEVQQANRQRLAQTIQWAPGAELAYLGQRLRLKMNPTLSHAAFDQALESCADDAQVQWHLHLGLPQHALPQQIRDATQAWLMWSAHRLFTQRLNHFAPLLHVKWTRLSLSNASTRWGSASADGRIRLNWRLIHFHPSVIDYVVAHELSHLRVMNHSPQFWDTVASVMPDYQQPRNALKSQVLAPWQ